MKDTRALIIIKYLLQNTSRLNYLIYVATLYFYHLTSTKIRQRLSIVYPETFSLCLTAIEFWSILVLCFQTCCCSLLFRSAIPCQQILIHQLVRHDRCIFWHRFHVICLLLYTFSSYFSATKFKSTHFATVELHRSSCYICLTRLFFYSP